MLNLSISQSEGKNIEAFIIYHNRLQRQDLLFMAFNRVPQLIMVVTTLLGQQHHGREKSTVALYIYYVNSHAGTPDKNKGKA